MKGSIRERSPGRWAIILDVPDPETGQRRRKWHSFAGTKRQAQTECARLITIMKGGDYVEPAKTTVAQHLERWHEHMRSQVTPRTHERYGEIIRKNLVPALGAVALQKLKPATIAEVYAKALTSGRRNGKGGLAPTTVIYMHRLLKHALGQAVQWGALNRNPADAVKPPKAERATLTTFDVPQTAELLEKLKGTRLFLPVALGVLCGLRRGEIVALRWGRVDLDGASLAIVESAEQTEEGVRYKAPKSGRGRRVSLSRTMVEELRRHRVEQAELLLRLGIRLGAETLVYAREDGAPLQPRSLTQAWMKAASATGLPRIRFHDLRHAHATHMLASGVHPKVASERLGHSRVGVTLDLYSHVLPGMQEDAASRVDEALRMAVEKRASEGIR